MLTVHYIRQFWTGDLYDCPKTMFQLSKKRFSNSTILSESAAHQCFFLETLCFEEEDQVLKTSLFVEKNLAIGFLPL